MNRDYLCGENRLGGALGFKSGDQGEHPVDFIGAGSGETTDFPKKHIRGEGITTFAK
jgi:hypothetical protein